MSEKIYVFGDSVLKGVVLDEQYGKYVVNAPLDADALSKLAGQELVNRSTFGATITRAKRVIDRTLKRQEDCGVAVLEFGGNDCNFDWAAVSENPQADHQPATTPDEFARIYEEIIRDLQAQGVRVVVANLPPIDSEYYLDYLVDSGLERQSLLSFLGDVERISRFQELYSNISERVAQKTGALLVDIRSSFLRLHNYRDHICRDGLHPSPAGHQVIYESLVDFIRSSDAQGIIQGINA